MGERFRTEITLPRGRVISFTLQYLKGLRLDDLAAAEAIGADAHALVAMRGLGVHWAQIDVPAPLGDVVRVTDVVS